MRHLKRVKKLGRTRPHRMSMLRNQVQALLIHGRIRTTLPKAKETRRWAERMITLAKRGDLHARRLARRFLVDRKVTNYLFEVYPRLFQDREGGYTRIYRLGPRRGDGAEMAILELVVFPDTPFGEKSAAPSASAEEKKA